MSVRSSRSDAIATSQQMANASKPGKCALGLLKLLGERALDVVTCLNNYFQEN